VLTVSCCAVLPRYRDIVNGGNEIGWTSQNGLIYRFTAYLVSLRNGTAARKECK
jgi:hypothetical protein